MNSVETKEQLFFLEGGGTCGELIRNYDWSSTALGDPITWSQSLRTAVDVMLHSQFPMLLWWGDEMIQFYNDAFIPNLDAKSRHPQAIGATAAETWPEIWEFITPIIQRVRHEKASIWLENQRLSILRNGTLEDSYWTLSYAPVRDESGEVAGILVVCQETADLVNTVQQLKESESLLRNTADRLQLALEAGQMGAYERDLITGYIDCNLQCKRNFGLDADHKFYYKELMGMVVEEDRSAMQIAVDEAIRLNSAYASQYRIRTAGGEIRWIDARGNAIYDKAGNAVKLIGITQNITDQKEISQLLQRKVKENTAELAALNSELSLTNKSLVFSNQELSQYAYVASHDLQEPLRKILVYANLINDKSNIPDNQKLWSRKIQQSAQRMSTLIHDLLAFSRLSEAERNYSPVDLNEVIDTVIADFEISIEDKKADLRVDKLCVVQGIGLQMQQLFANLISNSLKFTLEGRKPIITIRTENISDEDAFDYADKLLPGLKYCRILFSDNGVGFDDSYADQVFEVFKRLHANANYPGSGIGLALCKRIVNNHRGYIEARSTAGEGTTIQIMLPLH